MHRPRVTHMLRPTSIRVPAALVLAALLGAAAVVRRFSSCADG